MKGPVIFLVIFFPHFLLANSLKELLDEKPPFKLPALSYSYDALAPSIDAQTMTIHHTKHHQAYIDNANKLLTDSKRTLGQLLSNIQEYPVGVRNNVGGHFNHAFFWTLLSPDKKNNVIPKRLLKIIEKKYGSLTQFQTDFESAALSRFGSGWVWLVVNENKELQITTTANQDNPLMSITDVRGKPILAVDVWEHAYYLSYQNKRAEYLKQIWSVINWSQVLKYFDEK